MPQAGAVSQLSVRQQPLRQPASPGGQELLHQVEFVIPGAVPRDGTTPRIAALQTAGHDNGSGGSMEGVSELQPIPELSPRDDAAAADGEEAEYSQMVEEMQQVAFFNLLYDNNRTCSKFCCIATCSVIFMHTWHQCAEMKVFITTYT